MAPDPAPERVSEPHDAGVVEATIRDTDRDGDGLVAGSAPVTAPSSRQEAPIVGSWAGTLTLPEGAGPFPGVVLVSGSGPQDRAVGPESTSGPGDDDRAS